MKILGIDPSTRVLGLALIEDRRLIWAMSAKLKGNLMDRLAGAGGIALSVIKKEHLEVVVMETPGGWTRGSPRSSTRTVETLAMVRGAIGAIVASADIPCHEITVNRARHLVLGKGNPKKHVVMETLQMMGYDLPVDDDHAADALVVALAWFEQQQFAARVAAAEGGA